MSWNEGYVVDVEYTMGFYKELSPSYLNTMCVLNGVEPVPLDRPFTYCELGCGQGFSANILAASHPQGSFYAVDFMPAHIVRAQELTEAAGLANLTLLEASFADLAAGQVAGVPQFDFITLHGVYTWVSPENREHVVKFIARHLKPGGVVYVSFNTMPGWASTLPLQKLMMLHAESHPDRSDAQVLQARGLFDSLKTVGASYFVANEGNGWFKKHLDSIFNDTPSYLVHEYMNRDWQPVYFADVARHLATAKLDHVGSTHPLWAFPQLALTPAKRELVEGVKDPILRETIKDFVCNTSFRKEVFVRGARPMTPQRQLAWLDRMGVALTVALGAASLEASWPGLATDDNKESYTKVLEVLQDGPKTFPQLMSLCACGPVLLAEIAAFLIHTGQGLTYFTENVVDPAPAHAMNRAIAAQSRIHDQYLMLASPLLGGGILSGLVQRLVYGVLSEGGSTDADSLIPLVWERLRQQQPKPDIEPEAEEKEKAEFAETVGAILARRVPVWRQLGMI
jgi:predicted O-methyltransferase YrrM